MKAPAWPDGRPNELPTADIAPGCLSATTVPPTSRRHKIIGDADILRRSGANTAAAGLQSARSVMQNARPQNRGGPRASPETIRPQRKMFDRRATGGLD